MTQDHNIGQLTELERDMLEALRAVLRCNALPDGSPVGGGGGSSYASQLHVAGMVRAAIAKAEGRK